MPVQPQLTLGEVVEFAARKLTGCPIAVHEHQHKGCVGGTVRGLGFLEAGEHPLDRAEQPARLIDQMTAQVAKQATGGPAFQQTGLVLIEA